MPGALIFGATSAIAEAVARLWLGDCHALYLVGRNGDKLNAIADDLRVRATAQQRIEIAVADLTNHAAHARLIEQADRSLSGIDIALIAHGSLPSQTQCEASVDRTMLEVAINALSTVSLLTLLAGYFEARGRGTIVVIGSVAGERGRKSNYVYGACKGMVSIFLEGLRCRLASKGVTVLTVKPGFVITPMTQDLDRRGPLWVHPDTVARGIVRAVQRRRDVVYLPWFWWWIMLVVRLIPERIFKRMDL
jgi:decaprenylphospho-beta-D-erythro-pentofuranosid-2-ulose 2-reductase